MVCLVRLRGAGVQRCGSAEANRCPQADNFLRIAQAAAFQEAQTGWLQEISNRNGVPNE